VIISVLFVDFFGHVVEPFGVTATGCYGGSGITKWIDKNAADGLVTLGEIQVQCRLRA